MSSAPSSSSSSLANYALGENFAPNFIEGFLARNGQRIDTHARAVTGTWNNGPKANHLAGDVDLVVQITEKSTLGDLLPADFFRMAPSDNVSFDAGTVFLFELSNVVAHLPVEVSGGPELSPTAQDGASPTASGMIAAAHGDETGQRFKMQKKFAFFMGLIEGKVFLADPARSVPLLDTSAVVIVIYSGVLDMIPKEVRQITADIGLPLRVIPVWVPLLNLSTWTSTERSGATFRQQQMLTQQQQLLSQLIAGQLRLEKRLEEVLTLLRERRS
ncbi:hypothetical protein HK405_008480 [Cladochytrium tenue]|nr:hypothetical protein HK405_008480 [Cladochytrium tenue]